MLSQKNFEQVAGKITHYQAELDLFHEADGNYTLTTQFKSAQCCVCIVPLKLVTTVLQLPVDNVHVVHPRVQGSIMKEIQVLVRNC